MPNHKHCRYRPVQMLKIKIIIKMKLTNTCTTKVTKSTLSMTPEDALSCSVSSNFNLFICRNIEEIHRTSSVGTNLDMVRY